MCVLCVSAQQTGQSDQFKTVKATDFKFDMHVPRDSLDMIRESTQKFFEMVARPGSVMWPPKFLGVNANSSKMVKATDFKFDLHVSRESLDRSFKNFS